MKPLLLLLVLFAGCTHVQPVPDATIPDDYTHLRVSPRVKIEDQLLVCWMEVASRTLICMTPEEFQAATASRDATWY